MIRYCGDCRFETNEMFCPKCNSLTYLYKMKEQKSKTGEKFACTIGLGKTKGIHVGKKHRDKFFSCYVKHVILIIGKIPCSTRLDDRFWSTSPKIRYAYDDQGNNYLSKWIEENKLNSPKYSMKLKGKKDYVALEVIRPTKEFRVFIPKI